MPGRHRSRRIVTSSHLGLAGRRALTAGLVGLAWLALATPAMAVGSLSCLAVLCPAPVPADPPPAPTQGLANVFAPDGVWRQPLAADATLDPASDALVASLQDAVRAKTPWINTGRHSVPVYVVPADQPRVRVNLRLYQPWSWNDAKLKQDFASVPLPSNARPADGTDAELTVYQPASDTLWDFWMLQKNLLGSWTAGWGGKLTGVSTNPGLMERDFAATATSLPLLGGLMTIDELRSGHVDHALAFSMPHPRANTFVWPAQHTDGDGGPGSVPEGTRFRLPANLDVDALGLPPLATLMAKAVQRYGMVLRDKSESVAFYAQDPLPFVVAGYANPYTPIFGGQDAGEVLANFPWDRLQAVAP